MDFEILSILSTQRLRNAALRGSRRSLERLREFSLERDLLTRAISHPPRTPGGSPGDSRVVQDGDQLPPSTAQRHGRRHSRQAEGEV
uniref:Uncharacterized protein n=1 Tax=Steinernema glaseri TaxID=37863 RepID=A0A1I7YBQ7_9BILA